jgi:hypothetical protein
MPTRLVEQIRLGRRDPVPQWLEAEIPALVGPDLGRRQLGNLVGNGLRSSRPRLRLRHQPAMAYGGAVGRGRPPTGGRRDGVLVRLEPDQFDALDNWIAKQGEQLTRPEAIRRLVELGPRAKGK